MWFYGLGLPFFFFPFFVFAFFPFIFFFSEYHVFFTSQYAVYATLSAEWFKRLDSSTDVNNNRLVGLKHALCTVFSTIFLGFLGGKLLCTSNIPQKGLKMRKAFKIILVIFAILIIIVVSFAALFFLDLAAYTATGSKTLSPTGTSVGKAIVIYDPGLSGNTKNVADKVASDLQAEGYTVTLAGVKSSAAATLQATA